MANIFWDTNLFIYLFEDHPKFAAVVDDLRRRMLQRRDRLFTSAMTVGEILVKPLSDGNLTLVEHYKRFFTSHELAVSGFDYGAAEPYARIRQDRRIHPADAIQLACAASVGIDLFITNDERLAGKNVEGIKFITSLSRAPL